MLGVVTNVTPDQARSNLSSWFLNPPDWMLPPTIDLWGEVFFFSLALALFLSVIYPNFSKLKLHSPEQATSPPSAQIITSSTEVPNWEIRDLFLHLQPELATGNVEYDVTGNEVLDRLSTKQLKAWGRRRKLLGDLGPFEEIEHTYWLRAEFSYFFLFPDIESRELGHTSVDNNSGLPEYFDLHVNYDQALKTWPEKKISIRPNVVIPINSLSFSDLGQSMIDTGHQINSYIQHETGKLTDQQIVSHYHTHHAPHVIALYETAKGKGFSPDLDIEMHYQNPKLVSNVQNVGQRLAAMGQMIKQYV